MKALVSFVVSFCLEGDFQLCKPVQFKRTFIEFQNRLFSLISGCPSSPLPACLSVCLLLISVSTISSLDFVFVLLLLLYFDMV